MSTVPQPDRGVTPRPARSPLSLLTQPPAHPRVISCPWCDLHGGHVGMLLGYIRKSLSAAQLAQVTDIDRYEVALVMLPSYEHPSKFKGKRGYHDHVHRLWHIGQFIEDQVPETTKVFWALQLYDRQEEDPARRHSGIIFCGLPTDHAVSVDLTLTDMGRLQMNIADIKRANPWLLSRWVDRYDLFKGVDALHLRKKKGVKRQGKKATTTVLWHRFLVAAHGSRLGVRQLIKPGPDGKKVEPIEVHHVDDHEVHNCRLNLRPLRRSIHRKLTGAERARRSRSLRIARKLAQGAAGAPTLDPIHELGYLGPEPFFDAAFAHFVIETLHGMHSAAGTSKLTDSEIKAALTSDFISAPYKTLLRRHARTTRGS